MKLDRIKTLTAFIILTAIMLTGTAPIPALAETSATEGLGFAQGIRHKLAEEKIPDLPEYLNGLTRDRLEGYDRISGILEKIRNLRVSIDIKLFIYEDVTAKLSSARELGHDNPQQMSPEELFGEGAFPMNTEGVDKILPAGLTEAEKKSALQVLEDTIELLAIPRFQREVEFDEALSPKKARIFYDNARQKLENSISDDVKTLTDMADKSREDISAYGVRNMVIRLRAGRNEHYGGVMKNFQDDDPIVAGFICSTQGVDEEIPVEWKLTAPDGQVKTGKTAIEGSRLNHYVELFRDTFTDESPRGRYLFEVVTLPGDPREKTYSDHFMVGSIPLEITSAFILTKDRKPAELFSPGDSILLAVQYRPPQGASDSQGTFSWKVFNPDGGEVKGLSHTGQLNLRTSDREIQTKYIRGVIPKDAPGGTYKYQAQVTAGGERASSEIITFGIKAGFTVEISASSASSRTGDKVIFRSRVFGGTKPYKYRWESDTGSTSDRSDIAIIFTHPGKRRITLRVTDSSTPPQSDSTTVHVNVTEN